MNIEDKLEELRIKYRECEDPVRRKIYEKQARALKLSVDKSASPQLFKS